MKTLRTLLPLLLVVLLGNPATGQKKRTAPEPQLIELAGVALSEYPHFTHVTAFNEGSAVLVGIDTRVDHRLVNKTVDVYVMAHRSIDEWEQDQRLLDVHGSPLAVSLVPGGLKENVFTVDAGFLSGQTGTTEVGIGFDVVVDLNGNGLLDVWDLIDGWGDEAGFYVMPDLTQNGPYPTEERLHNGGGFNVQKLYYPTDIAHLGELSLIVVSHGNGHNYQWYDHIGHFMASWGYVVMSHRNNTGPGIDTAATTTLRNTRHFFAQMDVIADGVLVGHVDPHSIVWIGHSRGGEGVVWAYRRLVNGDPLAEGFYTPDDIKLISSMAPVVFLSTTQSDPGDKPYHLWTGGADNDVNGCANCGQCQTFRLHERASGTRMSTSLHGVGHGDFHDGGGSSVANGPCRVGRPDTHQIMRGYLLPLVKHVVDENIPCKDYLWRQWESLKPIGAPTSECVVVDLMFQESPSDKLVLDDFQTNPSTTVSSSGASVVPMSSLIEDRYDDANTTFATNENDPMNGMTLADGDDTSKGIVFEWDGVDEFLLFEVGATMQDLSGYEQISFRAAQSTRHPLTRAVLEDLTFSVQLIDLDGRSSTIHIGAYGGGVEEPYQRTRCGAGAGWANEFETIRIPLRDFRAMGSGVDLGRIAAVAFLFGPGYGSDEGRIGLDEIEFTVK